MGRRTVLRQMPGWELAEMPELAQRSALDEVSDMGRGTSRMRACVARSYSVADQYCFTGAFAGTLSR